MFLHDSSFDDIKTLLLYIYFYQSLISYFFILDGFELGLMQPIHIADISKPGIEQSQIFRLHGCLHSPTIIMSANHNVPDLQIINRILYYAQSTEVVITHQVCNIAVNKHLTRLYSGHFFGSYATITAPYI
jgi:hypothetical protein